MARTRNIIVGCGYVGRRLLGRLEPTVTPAAVVRSPESRAGLEHLGVETLQIDLDRPPTWPGVLGTAGSEMYYLVPPPRRGTTDPRLRAWLERLALDGLPRRIVYISTSGVYGDCGGAWVDETRPAHPESDRARRRYDAEQALTGFADHYGVPAVILRVPGIYGPGHLPLERLRRGLRILQADQAPYTNRVHVDDLVSACLRAMRHAPGGAIYNVSDGRPGKMADYFDAIAERFGLPLPPKIDRARAERELSPGMRAFIQESKRLSNRRLTEELGVELRYPDLASGLEQCAGEMGIDPD